DQPEGFRTHSCRQRVFKPQNRGLQKSEFSREPLQVVEENQAAHKEQQSAAKNLDRVQIFSETFIEGHELADSERGKEKRNGQPSGVHREQKNAAADGCAGGSETENRGENGANAGSPAKGERETEKETAPNAWLRDVAAEVNIAVEPAGQRGPEKADDGERKEVKGPEIGEQRGVADKRDQTQDNEQRTKDYAHPKT